MGAVRGQSAQLDLPKLQHFLVPFASVPDLRDGNSCGQVITDPPYQGTPNLGRITEPPYQGAQTLLCQMRQASMTIANVISFKAAFSICKAGTRTTTKPRIHRQHLRLAEADSEPDWPMPNRLLPFVLERGHEVRPELDVDGTLCPEDCQPDYRLKDVRNKMIKEHLLSGKNVCFRSSGGSLRPRVYSNDNDHRITDEEQWITDEKVAARLLAQRRKPTPLVAGHWPRSPSSST